MRTKKTRSLRRTKSTTEMGKYLDPSTGDLGMSDDSAFSDVTKKVSLGTLCVYISGTGNFRHPCVTWLQATQMFPRDSSLGRVEHNVPFLSLSPSGNVFVPLTTNKQKWLSLKMSPPSRRNTTFRAFSRRQMSLFRLTINNGRLSLSSAFEIHTYMFIPGGQRGAPITPTTSCF